MSKKSFANLPKPGRQPTVEEIEVFEETGRVQPAPGVTAPAHTERQQSVNTESSVHGGTEKPESAKTKTQDRVNTETQKEAITEIQNSVADQQAQATDGVVRLTIDLPESVHTRFKVACAVARRKMVQEVRRLIEERTAELEGGSAPPR